MSAITVSHPDPTQPPTGDNASLLVTVIAGLVLGVARLLAWLFSGHDQKARTDVREAQSEIRGLKDVCVTQQRQIDALLATASDDKKIQHALNGQVNVSQLATIDAMHRRHEAERDSSALRRELSILLTKGLRCEACPLPKPPPPPHPTEDAE